MKNHQAPQFRSNEQIRCPEVRVVTDTENKVLPTREAIKIAKGHGLDLIEISPTATPPVCKIADLGKYLYELEKGKKAQVTHANRSKEIGLHVNVAEHDLQTKLRQAEGFLGKKFQVLFRLKFRGRENTHKDMGQSLMTRIANALASLGTAEPQKASGNIMLMRVCPK